ncbi:ABC transporter ATP-binding protein [Methanofollis fontis]|uniref:ABC transporter n=1 Tax=Methanofollis fontis TaxID=2052832 RepID=A0A483CQU4_9EURY|nr:ABC transporter ATP-binding protein [Methanofollis fontis]TAJ45495.1 ABC transporter [Methanofollis fontis]
MQERTAICARGLTKRFGTFEAVRAIDFTVHEGEAFGFLGPNGAGKTTTMRMIQCASPRSGGDLRIFGMDPETEPREIKAILGIVPQENNLDPDLTGRENLLSYARYFGVPPAEAEERVEDLLDFVEVRQKADVIIESLSGGMRRRLILARALINDPRVLILDEPTTGLDPQARHQIWERLRALQREGRTIVLTTHYMEEAERLCDRLVIMDGGEVLARGAPPDLIRSGIGRHVIEAEPTDAVRTCLERHGIEYEEGGESIQVPADDPAPISRTLLDECGAIRLSTRPATLEDVFLRLTGRRLRE